MEFIKKNKLLVVICVLTIGFLVLIAYTSQKEEVCFLENGVGVTINPAQGIVYKVCNNIKSSFDFIKNYDEVKQENEELRKKKSEMARNAIENKLLKKENEKLRAMLDFKETRSEYDYIGCDVIGIRGNSFVDGFIINRGTKDGIKKTMVAVTADGLVGQVTSVGSNWAIVQTLANENIRVAGYVERTSENNGMVSGYKDDDNNLLAKIEIPTLESTLKKGDIILTSGIGQIYPKGIRIGEVIEVEEEKGKVAKRGIIKPYVEINKLEEVLIVIPKETREVIY